MTLLNAISRFPTWSSSHTATIRRLVEEISSLTSLANHFEVRQDSQVQGAFLGSRGHQTRRGSSIPRRETASARNYCIFHPYTRHIETYGARNLEPDNYISRWEGQAYKNTPNSRFWNRDGLLIIFPILAKDGTSGDLVLRLVFSLTQVSFRRFTQVLRPRCTQC